MRATIDRDGREHAPGVVEAILRGEDRSRLDVAEHRRGIEALTHTSGTVVQVRLLKAGVPTPGKV